MSGQNKFSLNLTNQKSEISQDDSQVKNKPVEPEPRKIYLMNQRRSRTAIGVSYENMNESISESQSKLSYKNQT